MSIYKDCDIRGIYPDEISEENAYFIGRASASMVPPGSRFAVGGDVRKSTPRLKNHLIRGLGESGIIVTDIGIVPTPLLYFAVNHLCLRGGIMVTASHNPPAYNGFKILLSETPITPREIKEIERRADEKDFRSGSGSSSRTENLEEDYLTFLKKLSTPPQRKLKIVVDCGNGCYAGLAPWFLTTLGYEIIPLFCERNGSFPNRPPNPSQSEYLVALTQTILNNNADAGIAFDGDGDRVVFADEKGQIILPEQVMIFFLRHLLPSHPPKQKYIYDIKCSRIVAEEVSRLGGIPLVERSGHTYIKTRLIQENAFMAGEISGHYFFRELHGDDGLYAALVFLTSLSQQSLSLSEIIATYPASHVTPDIRISTRSRPDLMTILEKLFSGEKISRIDGIRVEWPEGWGLLRKSVTEPVYTLRFEANHKEFLPQIVHRFLQSLPDVEQEVMDRLENNHGNNQKGNDE